MIEPAHPDSSSGLSTGARIFQNLFQDLLIDDIVSSAIILVVSSVSVDREMSVVTSSISKIRQLNLFIGARWSRIAHACIHRFKCSERLHLYCI